MLRKLLHVLPLLLLLSSPCWAQTAGWEFPTAASVTVSSSDNGKILGSDNVPGTFVTVTLANPSSLPTGWEMGFSTAGGHGIVVNAPVGVYIFAGQKQLTSFSSPSNTNYEFFTIQSDGTNYRLLSSTATTTLYNGLIGAPGGKLWTYLFSTGYTATAADNGTTITSALTGGATTITLPSTGLIPNGWAINLYANGQPITLNLNGVSGGSLITPNGGSVTSYVLPGTPTSYALLSFDGASFRVLIAAGGTTNFTVDSVAQLAALGAVTNNTTITTRGHSTPGDGGGATYTFSTANCSISGGDNGSEVQPTTGTGCWLISPPITHLSPMVFGAAGDGSTDDHVAVQNALNAAFTNHWPLWLGDHLYNLNGHTISHSAAGTLQIIGGPGKIGEYTVACSVGLTNTSSTYVTLLSLSDGTDDVTNLCVQAAPNAYIATGGYGILIVAPNSGQVSGSNIDGNAVINGYNGIGVSGNGSIQLAQPAIYNNTVRLPVNHGIEIGGFSTGANTNDVRMFSNEIIGESSAPTASAACVYIADAAMAVYDGNSAFACNVGLDMSPGSIGGVGQTVLGRYSGVLGDSSGTYDLLINPQTAQSLVSYVVFNKWWIGMGNGETAGALIENTTGAALRAGNISFVGGIGHGNHNNNPIIDLENDVFQIGITSNTFDADNAAANMGIGILNNSTGISGLGSAVTISNNIFGTHNQSLVTGVEIGSTADNFLIEGNNFVLTTTPVSWTPTNTSRACVKDNMMVHNNAFFDWCGGAVRIGAQSSGTAAIEVGSSLLHGQITLTGSTATSGSIQLNGSGTDPLNTYVCTFTPSENGISSLTAWPAGTTLTDSSNHADVTVLWNSNGTPLTSADTYGISYNCGAM